MTRFSEGTEPFVRRTPFPFICSFEDYDKSRVNPSYSDSLRPVTYFAAAYMGGLSVFYLIKTASVA